MSVHDLGDLQISGCSQASGEGEVHFTTNSGTIALSSLPEMGPAPAPAPVEPAKPVESAHDSPQAAVLEALAKLGELKAMGILTEEEFASKKAELLRRI